MINGMVNIMALHIIWQNWLVTLCKNDEWPMWDFNNVKAQYEIYLRDNRVEDFKDLYCPKCLEIFFDLIKLSVNEQRERRDEKWEQKINEEYGDHRISLDYFRSVELNILPQKYERYRIIRSKEEGYNIANIRRLHPLTLEYYHEATKTYISGHFLASILVIGATIDQFIRQLVDPLHKYEKRIPSRIFDDAVKEGHITPILKEEIREYKKTVRDHVAHPRARTTATLGFEYIEEEVKITKEDEKEEIKKYTYWGTKDKKPIHIGPKPGAEKGLELFWKLVKHVYKNELKKQLK